MTPAPQSVERRARRPIADPTIGESPSLTDFDVPPRDDDLSRVGRQLRASEGGQLRASEGGQLRAIEGGRNERGEDAVPDASTVDRSQEIARAALARAEAKLSFDEELARAKGRIEREAAREVERKRRETIAPFLEVLDDVDRALAASDDASDAMHRGVEMIRDRFLTKLRDQGVSAMNVEGEPFDPERHEAMSVVPVSDPALDNKVVGVIRVGYALGDDVLRPAGVAVGRVS